MLSCSGAWRQSGAGMISGGSFELFRAYGGTEASQKLSVPKTIAEVVPECLYQTVVGRDVYSYPRQEFKTKGHAPLTV